MQAVRDAQPAAPGTAVRAQAPLRLSFVGGGTDFPHYYRRHGGAVLSSTVDLYARVRVTARDDHQVVIRSHDLGHRVEYHLKEGPPPDGVLDLAKAAVERAGLRRGIDMAIECDAPPGSGLGGSSAVVTAIVAALSALAGHELPPRELAEVAHDVERVDAGIVGGEQDHYATAFGGLNLLEFTASGVRVEPVRVDAAVEAALQERLLFCYTGGVRTNLGLINRQIEMFERGRRETLDGMERLKQLAYEMRDALVAGALDRFGSMLHDAYVNKHRMNPHVTEGTPAGELYRAAREGGALGGKLCGAGGGGYLLVYCPDGTRERVHAVLEAMGGQVTEVVFTREGARAWREASR